ncbi:hypothetical protein LTR28_006660 [Elasticomyces elasticus]|nr:hypothetical protein LTR28_006660 [Elasticomyces elasticus]
MPDIAVPPWVHPYDPNDSLLSPPQPTASLYIPKPPQKRPAYGRKWDHLRTAEAPYQQRPLQEQAVWVRTFINSGPSNYRSDEEVVDDEWYQEHIGFAEHDDNAERKRSLTERKLAKKPLWILSRSRIEQSGPFSKIEHYNKAGQERTLSLREWTSLSKY